LLGRDTNDIDIAVAGDAPEIASRIASAFDSKYVLLDKVKRVSRVIMTGDDQWNFDFSTLKGSIENDLSQRDFTVDAMAIDLKNIANQPAIRLPMVIDPFGGWSDLNQGVIRVVTDAAFESDPVRLLRAVRLAAELGFTVDSKTESLIQGYSHLIPDISGERVREELLRLLAVPQTGQFLRYLDDLGLVTAIIPEMTQTKGVEQPKEHFWNVFDHSIETVAAVDFLLGHDTYEYADDRMLAVVPKLAVLDQHCNAEVSHGSTRRLLLKLSALLHDIAKPQTKAINDRGQMRFLGHTDEGAAIAINILERLRFSGKELKLVETLVKHHLRPGQMSHDEIPSRRAIYRYYRDTGDAGIDILFLSLADHLAARGPTLNLASWQEHTKMVEYVLTQRIESESLVTPVKLVDGHDLIDIFNMSPGPEIGRVLEAVREAQASGELTTRREILTYISEHYLCEKEAEENKYA
jgi:poly(A) polymerase